jgi:hypothetical protein
MRFVISGLNLGESVFCRDNSLFLETIPSYAKTIPCSVA